MTKLGYCRAWAGAAWRALPNRRGSYPWLEPASLDQSVDSSGHMIPALLSHDSSGEVGVAPLLGWIGMLPPLAGLAAVGMLWATPAARDEPRSGS